MLRICLITNVKISPEWCGSASWVLLTRKVKGLWFVSQSGYRPALWVGSQVRVHMRGN